jgi:hypothetical protein
MKPAKPKKIWIEVLNKGEKKEGLNPSPEKRNLKTTRRTGEGYHAMSVATGMLLSRIAGLVGDRIFVCYFGYSDVTDGCLQGLT